MKKFTMVVGFWAVGWVNVACSDSSGGEELNDPAGGNSGTSGQATGGYSGVATTGGTAGAVPNGGFAGRTGGTGGTGVTGGASGSSGASGSGGASGTGGSSDGGAGGKTGGKMGNGGFAGSGGFGGAQAGSGGGGRAGNGGSGMSGNGGAGNDCPADEPRMMCGAPGISCDYGDRLCRCNAMTGNWQCFDKADDCPAMPDPGGDCMGGSACSYGNGGLCVCMMREWVCD
jgi:hypothetical protein